MTEDHPKNLDVLAVKIDHLERSVSALWKKVDRLWLLLVVLPVEVIISMVL